MNGPLSRCRNKSHVIRQLVEVSQRPGTTGRRCKQLVTLARAVIAVHRAYLEHGHDAAWLTAQLAPLRAQVRELLEQCAAGRHQPTARFAAGLFGRIPGAVDVLRRHRRPDPADKQRRQKKRAVRHAVLVRTIQGGTQQTGAVAGSSASNQSERPAASNNAPS